jgi:hypothetical protein
MINDRPIENPKLREALLAIQKVMHRFDLAGACMLVAEEETAFTYKMYASWSALRPDADTPLGFRLRARSSEDGPALTRIRVEGAMHTICQLADFGAQTTFWMNDMKEMSRANGIEFDHTPFNGRELPHVYGAKGL